MKNIFATAINCIDGRTHKPVMEFVTKKFRADYVDLITEPGPDKVLSENKDYSLIESIKRRMLISVKKHNSKIAIIAGHHDCVANPVEETEHYSQIKEAVKNIQSWNLEVEVYGVWVDKNWKAELV